MNCSRRWSDAHEPSRKIDKRDLPIGKRDLLIGKRGLLIGKRGLLILYTRVDSTP